MQPNKSYNSTQNLEKNVCWVDTVSLISLLKLYLLSQKYSFQKVYYVKTTSLGRMILALQNQMGKSIFEKIEYNLSEICIDEDKNIYWGHNMDGSELALKIDQQIHFDQGLINQLSARYDRDKLAHYLKQMLACSIFWYVEFNNVVNHFINQTKSENAQHYLLVEETGVKFLKEPYRQDKIRGVFYYSNFSSSVKVLVYFFKTILEILINGLSAFFRIRPVPSLGQQPKIAVLNAHGVDMNRRGDLFWWKGSGIDPKDIFVYFRNPHRPPTKEILGLLEEYKIPFVDLIPNSPMNYFFFPTKGYVRNLWNVLIQYFCLLKGALLNLGKPLVMFQLEHLLAILNHAVLYESVCKEYNVKIHYALFENRFHMSASNLGVDLAGAIDVSSQYSNYPVVFIQHGKPCDVYFSFGPYYREMFDRRYYRMNTLLYSGYPYDSLFSVRHKQVDEIVKTWRQKGVEFIICFLDESLEAIGSNCRADFYKVYGVLLKLVEEDSKIGLLIKPKRMNYYENDFKDILERIYKLQEGGRCQMLSNMVMPFQAAAGTDIVIGFEIYNTAALEAALSGVPTVLYDVGGLDFHPFYQQGSEKLAFKDMDQLLKEVSNYKDTKKLSEGFANFNPFLVQMDPFRDGRASYRIGEYIQCLLKEINAGASKNVAIEKANHFYRERYGDSNVINFYSGQEVGSLRN